MIRAQEAEYASLLGSWSEADFRGSIEMFGRTRDASHVAPRTGAERVRGLPHAAVPVSEVLRPRGVEHVEPVAGSGRGRTGVSSVRLLIFLIFSFGVCARRVRARGVSSRFEVRMRYAVTLIASVRHRRGRHRSTCVRAGRSLRRLGADHARGPGRARARSRDRRLPGSADQRRRTDARRDVGCQHPDDGGAHVQAASIDLRIPRRRQPADHQ